jgi:thiamine-monophosphate kinase
VEYSEGQIIAELAKVFTRPDSRIVVGIGDDAAVVTTSHRTVISTDMAVEGVHFRRDWSTAFDIGRRITAANLADIYAMGATPDHLVVAVSLTGNESLEWIRELAIGIDQEARKCKVTVIGGDVVRGPVVTIAITALGRVGTPILRSGAVVGDDVVVSNLPGWSAAGLHLLKEKIDLENLQSSASAQRALSQYRAPTVAYEDVPFMRFAHAMTDVSDGLLVQGGQIALASKVRLALSSALIADHPDFKDLSDLATEVGAYVWDWIGAGGEDHVFLATGKGLPGFLIGEVCTGEGVEIEGPVKEPSGFVHFYPTEGEFNG